MVLLEGRHYRDPGVAFHSFYETPVGETWLRDYNRIRLPWQAAQPWEPNTKHSGEKPFWCLVARLELAVPYGPREGADVADIGDAGEIHDQALEAEAVARVFDAPVFA